MPQTPKTINELAVYELNPSQLAGLGAIAFLAIREKTSLYTQWEELGFTDLPEDIVKTCDEYDGETDSFELIEAIAQRLSEISSSEISITTTSGDVPDLAEILD